MTTDREQVTRRAARALDHVAERLAGLGVSDTEIGRAMVAAGLARWSRSAPAAVLAEELSVIVAGIADATGLGTSLQTPREKSSCH